MVRYIISPLAERDITGIWDYIAADNEHAARRLTAEFYAAFVHLAEMPGLGHKRADLTKRDLLFWTVQRKYLVAYRELEDAVEIVRVLDGRRDVASILG